MRLFCLRTHQSGSDVPLHTGDDRELFQLFFLFFLILYVECILASGVCGSPKRTTRLAKNGPDVKFDDMDVG